MSRTPPRADVPAQISETAERTISVVLRLGVLVSLLLVLAGSVVGFAHGYPDGHAGLLHLTGNRAPIPRRIGQIVGGAWHTTAGGLVSLGLLTLTLTPVARVVASIWGFAAIRDRTFVIITVVVLALLLTSFVAAIA